MKIYLDMDGVLTDFIGGCIKAHKKDTKHEDIKEFEFYHELWGMSDDDFWQPLQTASFWSGLDKEPGCDELVSLVRRLVSDGLYSGFEVVTRPSYSHPLSINGKLTWLKRLFGNDFSDVTFTENKYNLARNGVLIDDSERNYTKFKANEGKAILYPQYWNSNRTLMNERLQYTEAQLVGLAVRDKRKFVEPPDAEVISVDDTTGARKGTKLARYDLIPSGPLRLLAKHYGEGSKKYAERNWEKGYNWSKSFAALNRHLWSFWDGEDVDEETGSLHLTAATWHAVALTEYFLRNSGEDDRPHKR